MRILLLRNQPRIFLQKLSKRTQWLSAIIGAIVIASAVLSIVFAGSLDPRTATQIDGMQHITSIQTITGTRNLWTDKFVGDTPWKISVPSVFKPSVYSENNSLVFTVNFLKSSSSKSVSIQRNVSLSLDEDPIIATALTVSKGVNYGIRFFGVFPNGTSFVAWRESSPLQHRLGLGVQETVLANLLSESYLSTGAELIQKGSRIISILFYIEATPNTSGQFQMTVSRLSTFSYLTTALPSKALFGNFKVLMVKLDSIPTDQKLFQVFVGFDIKGSSDLRYTLDLTQNSIVRAAGYNYVPKTITTYEIAVLTPRHALSSSPLSFAGEGFSVIVAAISGEITYFRLGSISLRFTTQPVVYHGTIDSSFSRLLMEYYLVFIFVIPVTVAVLVNEVFKWKERSFSSF